MNELEKLVDAESIVGVIRQLAEICSLKEEHIRQTWQDSGLADIWAKQGEVLSKTGDKLLRIERNILTSFR